MQFKCTIYNSELEFRKQIESNSLSINKMYVYEDTLSNVIYFYAFIEEKTMIATKEIADNNYLYYYQLYKELNIPIEYESADSKTLILSRKKNQTF